MKKKILLVVGLTLGIASVLGIVVSAHGPRTAVVNTSHVTDAAFRDGLFQAKLDIQSGKGPHLASGRWSSYSDRALFIAGYQQGYREFSDAHPGKLAKPTAAQLAGYSDGMLDGVMHRRASQPFQANKTDNYRNAGSKTATANPDSEQYKQYYRRAYSDGYQQGYYAQPDQQELKTVGQTSTPF
ncbi:MAG TPA: hypothetical protein VEV41_20230 [Terriglobales bacterium]|nr:hypothetical protein [Terriglobales bacterium]